MRYFDKYEAKDLNAEQWQLDLLKLNPDYVSWGPDEDYMSTRGDGWNSSQIFESWEDFGPWGLDDLNEVVNFYFSVNRESQECDACRGTGYAPDAAELNATFHSDWSDDLTQDEVAALWKAKRLHGYDECPTAGQVNEDYKSGLGHDAINRMICVETRAARLGYRLKCPICEGKGYVYTKPAAHVSLVLWMTHPRKGCSRGIEVKNIQQTDLPAIYKYLRQAQNRFNEKFNTIPNGS